MNNRQKAKRFKQLYERTRTNFAPTKFETLPLTHYRAETRITRYDVCFFGKDILLQMAVDDLTRKLKPLVKDKMISTDDKSLDCFNCSIDVWVK